MSEEKNSSKDIPENKSAQGQDDSEDSDTKPLRSKSAKKSKSGFKDGKVKKAVVSGKAKKSAAPECVRAKKVSSEAKVKRQQKEQQVPTATPQQPGSLTSNKKKVQQQKQKDLPKETPTTPETSTEIKIEPLEEGEVDKQQHSKDDSSQHKSKDHEEVKEEEEEDEEPSKSAALPNGEGNDASDPYSFSEEDSSSVLPPQKSFSTGGIKRENSTENTGSNKPKSRLKSQKSRTSSSEEDDESFVDEEHEDQIEEEEEELDEEGEEER